MSLSPFDRSAALTTLPADLAALEAHVTPQPVPALPAEAPLPGAFNGAMATALTRWKGQ